MTQQVLASGQITLVDLNDAKTLAAFLNATQPKIQIYDPNQSTYTPDWSKTVAPDGHVVITPSLFVAGTATDIIGQAKSVTWTIDGTTVNPSSPPAGYSVGASNPWALTISSNVLSSSDSSVGIVATIVWTDTTFNADVTITADIEFSQVQNGTSSVTGILSNESAVVPTDSAGGNGVYGGAVTTMSVFNGATDDSANWTFSQNVVNLTGTASGSPSNRTFTTTGFSAGQDSGYVDITATKGAATITKRFNVSKNKQGANATAYWLVVDSSAITIQKNNGNIYSPTTINVTGKSQTGTGSPGNYSGRFIIEESTNGGSTWTSKYTSAADEATKAYTPTAQATSAINAIRVSLYASGGTTTLLDQQIVPLVSDGTNAITAFLTNDSVTLAADASKTVTNYGPATTTMIVYVGSTDDSANWTFTAPAVSGVTGALSTTGNKNVYTVTAMTVDSASVTITATKGTTTINKLFVLAKSIQGANATAYWLVSDTPVIRKSVSNVYTPTSINITGKSQTGSGSPGNYSGRFIIEETTDGSAWTTKYTSSADEATKAYTPTAQATSAIIQVRVSLYLAGGTTTLLDQQVIPLVSDGATGAPAITAYCWTPNGNTIRNSSGNLTAECDVYSGGTKLTSGVTYLWYKLISGTWTALTSANTGYNTATLTITPADIAGQSSFQCRATYNSTVYQDVVTVNDLTDPIQVTLIAAEGNVFKNGVGTKNITARVYRNGAEIDTSGNGYEYRWYILDSNGVKNTNWVDGANPTTAPTLTLAANAGSTLAAGTYYVVYTWVTALGETMVSPETSLAVTAGNNLVVTVPTFPTSVTSAKIYMSTATGTETYQGSTGTTTYTRSTAISAGAAKPASNTAKKTYTTGKTVVVTQDLVTNIGNLQCELWSLS